MDAAYLKSTVTASLVDGLAALARTAPDDPIDYLGRWLINHAAFLDTLDKVRGTGRGVGC